MAYENVAFTYNNFCISPNNQFCSVNYTFGANGALRVKTSSGASVKDYNLDTSVSEIKSLGYSGPRNVGIAYGLWGNDLPFFTLERDSSTQCTIREWRLNTTNSQLRLENTIVKSTSGSNYFNCYDMSVEYCHVEFSSDTVTGTGYIKVSDSVTNIEIGDELLLGPSSDVGPYQYATEWVEVTAISGSGSDNILYIDSITSSGIVPPLNEYVSGDDITYSKYIYLFSDIGQNNDSTKGSLYKLDVKDGSIVEVQNSGLYGGVRASAWSLDYEGIGIVKGNNLLYVDPNNNYYVTRSQTATNIEDNDVTIIPVYDLIFDTNSIYRLQKKITFRNNTGGKATTTWATYNYHQDTIVPYTLSIAPSIDPDGIVMNHGTITITVVVRDQFGVGLYDNVVSFSKTGDAAGAFDPVGGQVNTNSSGIATIIYQTDYYDPTGTHTDTEDVTIKAKTDGGSALLGAPGGVYTGWIWDEIEFLLWRKFTADIENIIQKPTLSGTWPTEGSDLYTQVYLKQLEGMDSNLYLKGLSKFQFPGGHWVPTGPPTDPTKAVTQLQDFESDGRLNQLDEEFENTVPLVQEKQVENDLQVSQTTTSRHVLNHHKDDVDINQFKFVEDAIPPFWSEKNPVDTNIWIHLRPYAFDLNQSTLVFKVREVSYAGDTGYIDVTGSCVVVGDGSTPLGLYITYNPVQDFHHHAMVFVTIEIYDNAPTSNIILTDYWFKIIPDYKAPYIENEDPTREKEDVALNTNIEFDILDAGVGVDIDSLEFFVNNRIKTPTVSGISGGYHVSYNPPENFFYGETVEITVKVKDASDYQNILYDMWRFHCVGSTGPWIDRSSIYPKTCSEGVRRNQTNIYVNMYAIDGTGLDKESILVEIGGKERDVKITPIIYRLS